MMLKVGGKLLCKLLCKSQNLYLEFDAGKYYTISKISYDSILIDDWWFSLTKIDVAYWSYIWDYFYTPQEVRKLKLKQLKQC